MGLKLDSAGATAEVTQSYDWRDVALYALSLGAGTDDLPFVVELGANNRCYYCGASFSSYVLSKAESERRRQPTAGD